MERGKYVGATTIQGMYLDPRIVSAEIIQGRKLFKGGNYKLLGGFDRGNYSREETIRGNTVCAENFKKCRFREGGEKEIMLSHAKGFFFQKVRCVFQISQFPK